MSGSDWLCLVSCVAAFASALGAAVSVALFVAWQRERRRGRLEKRLRELREGRDG
jgi:hypothetical protein